MEISFEYTGTKGLLTDCWTSGAFMYAGGNAGIHRTYDANRWAFQKYGIIPRMLVDATFRDIRVSCSVGFTR